MANEDTQARDDALWWAADATSDTSLPTTTFDEPLEWPDALPWAELDAGERPGDGFPDPEHLSFDLLFPPSDAASVVEAGRGAGDRAAGGDGGDLTELHLEALPDSIWSADPRTGDEPPPLLTLNGSISTDDGPAAATFGAEPDRRDEGRRFAWLTLPRGNAAVIALICFASLVLLGMFLSVRARNGVATDTSQTRTARPDIAASRPLNTIPLDTATTGAPPSTIALSDLVPATEEGAAGTGAGSPSGTTPRAAAPAATAAPRSATTAPAATQPTTATTATTAAPTPPPDTTPPATSPPPDDTTQTTRRSTPTSIDFPRPDPRATTTSISWPSITWPPGYEPPS